MPKIGNNLKVFSEHDINWENVFVSNLSADFFDFENFGDYENQKNKKL